MQYGLKMLVVSIPLVLSYSATAGADAHTDDATASENTHCLSGCPSGAPSSNIVLSRDIYTLSNNGSTKLAQWVAYVITTQTIGKSPKRVWRRDPDLPADQTLSPDDYKGANAALAVDRGHQVPLASFAGTDDWKETNYLSNITPQKSALNQGAWVKLETAARTLAQSGVSVFALSGPLFETDMPSLPADDSVTLPSGYWKILAITDGNTIEAAAFVCCRNSPSMLTFASN